MRVFLSSLSVSSLFYAEGGGAHARGSLPAAKSRRAPEVRAADQVHRHPRFPDHHHVGAPRVETLRLARCEAFL